MKCISWWWWGGGGCSQYLLGHMERHLGGWGRDQSDIWGTNVKAFLVGGGGGKERHFLEGSYILSLILCG